MSTAGKVLIAVVSLMLLGWIFMFAQVSKLTTNWGKEIDRLTEQVATLDTDIQQSQDLYKTTLAEITYSQNQRDKQLSVLRARLSDVEKLQAIAQESTIRVGQQIEQVNASLAAAEKASADRLAEIQQTRTDITDAETAVEGLQQSVAQRLDQLLNLREEFLAVRTENQRLLEQLRNGTNGETTQNAPHTRAASFTRP